MQPKSFLGPQTANETRYCISREVGDPLEICLDSLGIPRVDPSLAPSGDNIVEQDAFYVTVQIFAEGRSFYAVPLRSNTARPSIPGSGHMDGGRSLNVHCPQISQLFVWRECLSFPLPLSSIPRSARLLLEVLTLDNVSVGGTSISIFDSHGVLRRGLQKLLVWPEPEEVVPSLEGPEDGEDRKVYASGFLPNSFHDTRFNQWKARENYRNGDLPRIEWQDRAIDSVEQAISFTTTRRLNERTVRLPHDHKFHSRPMFLYVDFPTTEYPILFEEKLYRGLAQNDHHETERMSLAHWCKTYRTLSTRHAIALGAHYQGGEVVQRGAGGGKSGESGPEVVRKDSSYGEFLTGEGIIAPALDKNTESDNIADSSEPVPLQTPSWARKLTCGVDHGMVDWKSSSPVQNKYLRLSRGVLRGLDDHNLKPNREEREAIARIVSASGDHLTRQESDLLWRFRHSLVEDGKAVEKFVLVVDWADMEEVKLASALLSKWAPMAADSALKLLSARFSSVLPVRRHAIAALQTMPDDDLAIYLLQLVQALRYEEVQQMEALIEQDSAARKELEIASLKQSQQQPRPQTKIECPLLDFLVDKARRNVELASLLFWYVTVETEDERMGNHFRNILQILLVSLSVDEQGREIAEAIQSQKHLIDRLRFVLKHALEEKGQTSKKVKRLQQALQPGGACEDLRDINVVLPLDSSVRITGVVAETARMFASATYPMALEWYMKASEFGGPSPQSLGSRSLQFSPAMDITGRSASGRALSMDTLQAENLRRVHSLWQAPETVRFVYKGGDDMRQDQLVIQLITLIDRLFKRVNLDLRLTMFKVFVTSRNDGLLEFIEGETIKNILSKHKNNIQAYFRAHHPDEKAKYGIDPEVMETFIRSSAGYCVITYILGIGDRHLENLMIKTTGHLVHSEFSLITASVCYPRCGTITPRISTYSTRDCKT